MEVTRLAESSSAHEQFYADAQRSLIYLRYLLDDDTRFMEPSVKPHPSGIVFDQQLFNSPVALSHHLNEKYCAAHVSRDAELIPESLGLPVQAHDEADVLWLSYWHRQAEQSAMGAFYLQHEPGNYPHALRVPNTAAALAAVRCTPQNDPQRSDGVARPYTIFQPDRFCLMLLHRVNDAWFVAGPHYWAEEFQARHALMYHDPEGYLGDTLDSLASTPPGIDESHTYDDPEFSEGGAFTIAEHCYTHSFTVPLNEDEAA